MTRIRTALAAGMLAAALTAQETTTAAPPEWTRFVPATHTNLLWIGDVLPTIENVLNAPELEALLRDNPVFEALELTPQALAQARGAVALASGYVPSEVVLAATPETLLSLASVLHADALFGRVLDPDADDDPDALAETVALARATVEQITAPNIVGRIRTRDPRTAEDWFDAMADMVDRRPPGLPLIVSVEDSAIVATFDEEALAGLRRSSLHQQLNARDEALAEASHEALLRLCTNMRLELQEGALVVRIGEPAEQDVPSFAPGQLYGDAALAYVHRDFAAAESELWSAFAEWTEYGMLGPLAGSATTNNAGAAMAVSSSVERLLTETLSLGESVLRVDRGLEAIERSQFLETPDFAVAAATAIASAVEPENGPFIVTSVSLDIALLVQLTSVDTRLRQRIGRLEMRSDPTSRALAAAQSRLEPLLDFFASEESSLLGEGCAMILEGSARIDAVRTTGTDATEWSPTDLSVPGIALIATTVDDASAWIFAERFSAAMAPLLGVESAHLEVADLGLGVESRRLVCGGSRIELEGDFLPHWAVGEGLIVAATDTALTRRLFERVGSDRQRTNVGDRITWARATGAQLTALIENVAAWTTLLEAPAPQELLLAAGYEGLTPERLDAVRTFLSVFAALMGSIDHIEVEERIDGTSYHGTYRLRLRDD